MARKITVDELQEDRLEKTLSSGVTVILSPFPAKLFERINERAMREYPDPIPPKKTIKALGGEEIVDDLNDPDYVAKADEAKKAREAFMAGLVGDAAVKFCVQVDLSTYEPTIADLEEFTGEKFSTDPQKRRIRFLEEYAIRGRADWEKITGLPMALMAVGDKEVAERINSFQSNLARPSPNGAATPGANESERVEMVSQTSQP